MIRRYRRLFSGVLLIVVLLLILMKASSNGASRGTNGIANIVGFDVVRAKQTIEARAAILIEPDSGQILFSQNEHQRLPPASITKTMTMLLVMEAVKSGRLNWSDQIIASKNAAGMGGSQIYLKEGEVLTAKEIFKALVVKSANDASTAIAEHLYGTTEAFVKAMNRKAKVLGLQNTNFVNETGLPEPNHYSSAHDLAVINRELLLKYPEILQFTTIKTDCLRDGQFSLKNTNELLGVYQGTDGLKTGYTREALYCLAATANRDNFRLLTVILGAETNEARFSQTSCLLDYGYQNYCRTVIFSSKKTIGRVYIKESRLEYIPIKVKKDYGVVVVKGKEKLLKTDISVKKGLRLPIKSGDRVGTALVYLEGKEIGRVPIYSVNNVSKANLLFIVWRSIRDLIGGCFRTK